MRAALEEVKYSARFLNFVTKLYKCEMKIAA